MAGEVFIAVVFENKDFHANSDFTTKENMFGVEFKSGDDQHITSAHEA